MTHGSNLFFTAPGKTTFLIWPVGWEPVAVLYSFCFNPTQASVNFFPFFYSFFFLVKIPPLMVIKFALVPSFFLLSLLPICVVRLALSHSVLLSSLTVSPPLRAIDLCSEPRFSGRSPEGGGRLLLGGASFLPSPQIQLLLPWQLRYTAVQNRLHGEYGVLKPCSASPINISFWIRTQIQPALRTQYSSSSFFFLRSNWSLSVSEFQFLRTGPLIQLLYQFRRQRSNFSLRWDFRFSCSEESDPACFLEQGRAFLFQATVSAFNSVFFKKIGQTLFFHQTTSPGTYAWNEHDNSRPLLASGM